MGFVYVMVCSCAPMLKYFSVQEDGATKDYKISNHSVSSSLVIVSCLFSVRAIYSLARVNLKSLAKLFIRAWFPRPFYECRLLLGSLGDCVFGWRGHII